MTLQGFYTNKGRALAAKITAGTTEMTVTRIVAGSGHTADIPSATDLPEQKQTLHTGIPSVSGSTATLPVTLLEAEAASSYDLTELGVYAADPDAGEILFQVYQLDRAEHIVTSDENALRFYLRQSIGSDGVTVTCSPAGVLLEEDIAELRVKAAHADHRNLLDNPFFTVNQRGQTEYLSDPTTPIYCVDRWALWGQYRNTDKLTVTENGVIINVDIFGGMIQAVASSQLRGCPLLLSFIAKSNNSIGSSFLCAVYSCDRNGVSTALTSEVFRVVTSDFTINTVAVPAVPNDSETLRINLFKGDYGTGEFTFRAVKLEAGPVSTLENDTAPNYAEELAKCQRYFQIFRTEALRQTDKDDFRLVMRVDPVTSTVTIDDATYYTASADL